MCRGRESIGNKVREVANCQNMNDSLAVAIGKFWPRNLWYEA